MPAGYCTERDWDAGGCSYRYDAMVVVTKQFHFDGCPLVYWPYYASSFFWRTNYKQLLPKLVEQRTQEEALAVILVQTKTKFCAFCVLKCWQGYTNNDIMLRVIFFDLLAEMHPDQPPDSLCTCRTTRGIEDPPARSDFLDGTVFMVEQYRFALVFENNRVPGYVTEKITNALLADTVPIYWGAPDIAEHINMDRIIHCNLSGNALQAFRSLPRPNNNTEAEKTILLGKEILRQSMMPCLEEVMRLDASPELWAEKLMQPILRNKRIEGSYFDLNRVAKSIHAILHVYNSSLSIFNK